MGLVDDKGFTVVIRLAARSFATESGTGDPFAACDRLRQVCGFALSKVLVAPPLIPEAKDDTTCGRIGVLNTSVPKRVAVGRPVRRIGRVRRYDPLEPPGWLSFEGVDHTVVVYEVNARCSHFVRQGVATQVG